MGYYDDDYLDEDAPLGADWQAPHRPGAGGFGGSGGVEHDFLLDPSAGDARSVTCACGRVLAAYPYPADGRHPQLMGRLCYPQHSPCEECQDDPETVKRKEAVKRRQSAMHAAGIPLSLRQWSLKSKHQAVEMPILVGDSELVRNERAHVWREHVRRCRLSQTIAIAQGVNRHAAAALWRWKGGSVWISGGTGCGKTTLMGGWACDQMPEEAEESWWAQHCGTGQAEGPYVDQRTAHLAARDIGVQWRPVLRRVEVGQRRLVWTDQEELMTRVRLSWSGDKDPLKKVSEADILCFDDLGSSNAKGTVPQPVQDALERLICFRYERRMPIIATSNYRLEEIEEVIGKRAASRLHEMCEGQIMHVDAEDMRTAPQRVGS